MADQTTTEKPNKVLQFLDNAAALTPAGMVDRLVGAQFRRGMGDFVTQTVGMATWLLADAGRNGDGDRRVSSKVEQAIDDGVSWILSAKDGKTNYAMASGWQRPKGMAYNGKIKTSDADGIPAEGGEINNFSAIFVRNKKGDVELMDRRDPRWAVIVGPYVATQVALAVASGGAGSIKGAGKAVNWGGKAVAALDTMSGVAFVGDMAVSGLVLKPAAVDRLARIFQNPEKVTLGGLTQDLNRVMEQFSYKEGSSISQYYVPSLQGNQATLKRLEDISKARIDGFERETPFDRITNFSSSDPHYKKNKPIANVSEILENPYFQQGYYAVAEKAIQGKPLSPNEELALRFGMNVKHNARLSLSGSAPSASGQAGYTEKDKAATLQSLRENWSVMIVSEDVERKLKTLKPEEGGPKNDQELSEMIEAAVRLRLKDGVLPDQQIAKYLHQKGMIATERIKAMEEREAQFSNSMANNPLAYSP